MNARQKANLLARADGLLTEAAKAYAAGDEAALREVKGRMDSLKGEAEQFAREDELNKVLLGGGKSNLFPEVAGRRGGSGMFGEMKAAGWDVANGKNSVTVDTAKALGFGRKDGVIATQADLNVVRLPGIAGMGQDSRFIAPFLPTQNDVGFDVTSIQYLRQSVRSLPAAGSTELASDHATDKPTTDATIVKATAETKVFGTVTSPQPNVFWNNESVPQLLQREAEFALRRDIDLHVVAALAADANISTSSQGADTVIDAVYKAGDKLRDNGYVPSLIIVNSGDAQPITLAKDANDRYYGGINGGPFGGVQMLTNIWGIQTVVTPNVASGTAYVVDTSCLDLHLSPMKVDLDLYTYFARNATRLRAEFLGCLTISQGAGINKLTLS